MTEKGYAEALKKIMNINFDDYDNGKDFTAEFNSGKTIWQVVVYIKYYSERQQKKSFLTDQRFVSELENRANEINKKIDEIAKEVDAKNYHPNFAYFVRSYWDTGYELHIYRRNKIEEEEEERKAFLESPRGQYMEAHDGEDPCEFCEGYSCKSCKYGDDGRYSIYDVYSPSELL